MKTIFAILFVISSSSISLSQTNQQPKHEAKPEKAVTEQQNTDMQPPKRSFRPKLTLQSALKLAEKYIEKEKIDISPFYLFEAKFTLYGSKDNQEPCWFFWWVNENGAFDDYVFIVVSIETGEVRRMPSI